MDIQVIKGLIRKYQAGHSAFVEHSQKAWNYYMNRTDILTEEPPKDREENPMRSADNRIPFNFHGLLVNQKASYMFTSPPLFDLGNKGANKKLSSFLGDKYPKVCKDLCIDASNSTVGWLHIWRSGGGWKYANVPAEQIIPVWSKNLENELLGCLRRYQDVDDVTGDVYTIYEYWNDTECDVYRLKAGDELEQLIPYQVFIDPVLCEPTGRYEHGVGEVPFFPFFNNNINTNDLINIKPLIDTYCKVFSGFLNDLEDIQEVIFVLTNYGGANLREFLTDLKEYKAIQIDSEGGDDKSGVSTLTIEIPVEAREKLLKATRQCIFEQGQGIDPDPQNFGNSSGVALNFLYSLLELKAGLQETEFRLGFGRFIRCVCRLLGLPIKDDTIVQTWTRTSVRNDLELSQIAQQSKGIISDTTIIARHPWVEDPEKEEALLAAEKKAAEEAYQDAFGTRVNANDGDDRAEDGDGDLNDNEK